MGKPIYAQRVINEELEWQEVQIQLEKQLVDESSGGVMHSSIHDINHRARRVIDDPEAPDADAKPHWRVHEQALRTKGENHGRPIARAHVAHRAPTGGLSLSRHH